VLKRVKLLVVCLGECGKEAEVGVKEQTQICPEILSRTLNFQSVEGGFGLSFLKFLNGAISR
jgi:hypothetical protein